jgi:hypothetical protein
VRSGNLAECMGIWCGSVRRTEGPELMPSGTAVASTDTAAGPIVVFLGPTLPLTEAQEILHAIYVPPVAQGDIVLAAHAFHPRAMILIDGQFEDRPAVRHKEILWAMAQGISMIGAASMGALRAAELYDYGMVGVGAIYRWYRRWPLAPDDAVTIQSGPADLGFPPLTHAMIDLQATFSHLMRRSLVMREERGRLTETARRMNFRDRSFDAVLQAAGWSAEATGRIRRHMIERKRLDAIAALQFATQIVTVPRSRALSPVIATNTFIRDLEAGGIDPDLLSSYPFPQ